MFFLSGITSLSMNQNYIFILLQMI